MGVGTYLADMEGRANDFMALTRPSPGTIWNFDVYFFFY